jgi:hypothetical protein
MKKYTRVIVRIKVNVAVSEAHYSQVSRDIKDINMLALQHHSPDIVFLINVRESWRAYGTQPLLNIIDTQSMNVSTKENTF